MTTMTGMMSDLAGATDSTLAATVKEGAIAAHLLALAARNQCPTATTVLLEVSTKGNWLVAVGISGSHRSLAVVAEFEDEHDAASHFYWPYLEYVPGLTFARNHENITNITMDIQSVLNQMEGPPPTPPENPTTEPETQIRAQMSGVS